METRIADIVEPRVFANYVRLLTTELSELVRSGIAASNPIIRSKISGGGTIFNLPFWKPLDGEDEVLTDQDGLTDTGITAREQQAAVLLRGKSFASNELASAIAGDSAQNAIEAQIAQWWARREQKILLAVLQGIFDGPLNATHSHNISANAGAASIISEAAILDTKQRLGDAAGQLAAVMMHSATYTHLQKLNLIKYAPIILPNTTNEILFRHFLGYRVVVDDGCPYDEATGTFRTYLFRAGAISRDEGSPTDLTRAETERDAKRGIDRIVTRRAFVIHPNGLRYTNAVLTGVTPTNEDLTNPTNWVRVFEPKHIGIVELRHRITEPPPPPTPPGP